MKVYLVVTFIMFIFVVSITNTYIMSKITESKITEYRTSNGEAFYSKIDAEFHQSRIEIKNLFDKKDFEYGSNNFDLDGGDMAIMIEVAKILKTYNQI